MQAFLTGGGVRASVAGVNAAAAKGQLSGKKSEKLAKFDTKLPWIEKYRPRTVDEIASQSEVVAVLKNCVTSGKDIPNLLFYGPPGTGKTSAILAACRQLFGLEACKTRVLELNASDERGIQVIREKVKNFAQTAVSNVRPDGKPCPALKIVILDEADNMTSAAQAALRRTMERESRTTRFCLVCNYISRIIEPLTSRCAKFRFKPLGVDVQKERLRMIASKESLEIDDEAFDRLVSVSGGDLRRSITLLQSAARFTQVPGTTSMDTDKTTTATPITVSLIDSLSGVIPRDCVQQLIHACKTGSYDAYLAEVESLIRQGHAAYQLLIQLNDVLLTDSDLNNLSKAIVFDRLALCEQRLLDGADEFLQLMDLACVLKDEYSKATH